MRSASAFDLSTQPLEESAELAGRLFCEIYRGVHSRRVAPSSHSEDLRTRFRNTLQDRGVGIPDVLREFEEDILPNSMGTPHPLYLGLINSSPFPAGALADLLVSSLNNNSGARHQSPAISACEDEVVRAFRELFDLPSETEGMTLPGGTLANLQAIVFARTRAFPDRVPAGARLYTSAASHFSISRAARIAGIPASGIVAIPTRGRGTMDVRVLAERIREDRREGRSPFCVVGTLGTTGTGAIDLLEEIGSLAEREKMWFHVDACYGGAARLMPALRSATRGVRRADSVAVDPHKWFFIPMTAGLLLTRHPSVAREAFDPPGVSYIPGDGVDPWQRGIPTSRRSAGLTIWMSLRAHGWDAVREAVRRNIDLTRMLERLLEAQKFTILPGGELSIACARWELPGEESDEMQTRIAERVCESGEAWFSTTRHEGRTWLRFNLVNLYTTGEDIRHVVQVVAEAAQSVTVEMASTK